MTFAPSEGADQPVHPLSLIRGFVVRSNVAKVLSFLMTAKASEDSDQTLRMPRLI